MRGHGAHDPAILVYTSGTTGPPKGALMPHQCLLGNLPGFVHSHDGYPREGDLFWSPAELGVDRRLDGCAVATMYFGPADRRLSRPIRSGTRACADGEIRRAQCLPVPDRTQDDDGRRSRARASASISNCAA
jgi:acyl-CoA synthetase (AMP-forming)/AMP-acid ligase II